MAGVDSMQALLLTLRILPIEVRSICHHRGLRVYWEEEGDDMGFPEAQEST